MSGTLASGDKRVMVAKLRELLDQLEPTDELWPNEIQNLAVYRDGVYTAFVEIGTEEVEFFQSDGEEP